MNEGNAAWRTRNVGRVLFAAADTFAREKLRVVRERGSDAIPQVQMALFENLDGRGTRLTDLAARACMTKQSMSDLVDKAEASNFVERWPDRSDMRAKIIAFTPRGLRTREVLCEGIAAAERHLAEAVGRGFLDALKAGLDVYVAAGDRTGPAPDGEEARRGSDAGRVLSDAADAFVRDMLRIARQRGCGTAVHVQMPLFRALDLGGTRLTDIAARASMTKQAMLELVDKAQAAGLVERRPDPDDRRAKFVAFTADGLAMLEAVRKGVAGAERRMVGTLGRGFVSDMKDRLTVYAGDSGVFKLDGSSRGDIDGRSATGDVMLLREA